MILVQSIIMYIYIYILYTSENGVCNTYVVVWNWNLYNVIDPKSDEHHIHIQASEKSQIHKISVFKNKYIFNPNSVSWSCCEH